MHPLVRHSALPAMLAGLIFGCGARRDTVRVGALLPLTGDAAAFGHSIRQGYELAVEEWNAMGGLLGRKVQLLFADDRGEATEAAAACTRLIHADRVAALLGPPTSRAALAAAPVAQAERIPMLTPSASDPKVTLVGDCIFRGCFTDPYQGEQGARFAFENLSARKAACLFDGSNDYSRSLGNCFKASFAERGGRIVGDEAHAPGAVEFRAQLTRILPAQPDLLYLPGYVNDVARIAREARHLGYSGPILGGDGWDSPRLPGLAGDAVEHGYFTSHCASDLPDPMVQTYVRKHLARYQTPPDALAILGYDAVYILMDAIGRAGSSDPAAIREALQRTDFRAVSGQIRFDRLRNPAKPATLMEISHGRQVCRVRFAAAPVAVQP